MPSRPSAPSPWAAAARVVAAMRLKLPPSNADIGWRVEFRTMEVQLTDFENAARGATLHNTPAELPHAPQTIPHPTPGLKWWGVHRIPDPRTAGRGGPAPLPSPSSRSCSPVSSSPSRCLAPFPPRQSPPFCCCGQNNPDGPVFCKMGELAPRSSLFILSGERGYLGKPREPKRTPENGGRVNEGHPPPPPENSPRPRRMPPLDPRRPWGPQPP